MVVVEKAPEVIMVNPVKEEKKRGRKPKGEKAVESKPEYKLMIMSLLGGVTSALAQRNPVWSAGDAELLLIAEPASRILERMENVTSERLDGVSLILGIGMYVGPRIS